MNPWITVLLFWAFCVSAAADVAFMVYTNDPSGIPNGWPATAPRELGTNSSPRDGEVVMTRSEYEAHIASLKTAKDAWNKAQEAKERPALVWSAKEFDERVEAMAPGAWDRLEDLAVDHETPPETRKIIRAAIRLSSKAVEVVSTNPDTVRFMAMAVAVGVLTQDQSEHILGTK